MDAETVGAFVDFIMRAARHARLVECEWGTPPAGLEFADWFGGLPVDADVVYDGLDLIVAMLRCERNR
jgi:hypothetical protein